MAEATPSRLARQRSGQMAATHGLDPINIEVADIEDLACRCAKCAYGDACLIWHLEAADTAAGPPAYCLNREWILARSA